MVFGLTYDFVKPYYQSGTDAHLDWALWPILTNNFQIGAVGYVYNRITGDSGAGARLGDLKYRASRELVLRLVSSFRSPIGSRT